MDEIKLSMKLWLGVISLIRPLTLPSLPPANKPAPNSDPVSSTAVFNAMINVSLIIRKRQTNIEEITRQNTPPTAKIKATVEIIDKNIFQREIN